MRVRMLPDGAVPKSASAPPAIADGWKATNGVARENYLGGPPDAAALGILALPGIPGLSTLENITSDGFGSPECSVDRRSTECMKDLRAERDDLQQLVVTQRQLLLEQQQLVLTHQQLVRTLQRVVHVNAKIGKLGCEEATLTIAAPAASNEPPALQLSDSALVEEESFAALDYLVYGAAD